MNELSRHIEILLLDNDCVIVPGFGGFMAHHAPAEYLDDAGLFYPPRRTLGFNPQLQLNDSLLAQSYVEAYDISYPEAVRKIESEVEEIRQVLTLEGSYEFHGIGVITLMSTGKYDFQPCAAGLLTPNLYALDSFGMDVLVKDIVSKEPETQEPEVQQPEEPKTVVLDTVSLEEEERSLQISFSTLRNVLAVAMLLLLFVFSSIPVGRGSGNVQKCSIIDTELISSIITTVPKFSPMPVSKDSVVASADSVNALAPVAKEEKPVLESPKHYFTIVLASRVSKSGAEDYVSRLRNNGMNEVSVFEHTCRKVIYGRYTTSEEARKALSALTSSYPEFSQAWTTEINQ